MEKKLWFRNKRYGWGWYPASWEGWATLGVYLLFFLAGELTLLRAVEGGAATDRHDVSAALPYMAYIFTITATLVVVCWKTGEKPEWRWGGKPLRRSQDTDKK